MNIYVVCEWYNLLCKRRHSNLYMFRDSGPKYKGVYKSLLYSWDRASQFNVNKCPTRWNYTQFILSVNCSTCFGWFLHPSSGAQITVAIVEEFRLRHNSSTIATGNSNCWLVPDAADTVICADDDGWRNHPKHVEQFIDKINCVQLHLVGHLLTYIWKLLFLTSQLELFNS